MPKGHSSSPVLDHKSLQFPQKVQNVMATLHALCPLSSSCPLITGSATLIIWLQLYLVESIGTQSLQIMVLNENGLCNWIATSTSWIGGMETAWGVKERMLLCIHQHSILRFLDINSIFQGMLNSIPCTSKLGRCPRAWIRTSNGLWRSAFHVVCLY